MLSSRNIIQTCQNNLCKPALCSDSTKNGNGAIMRTANRHMAVCKQGFIIDSGEDDGMPRKNLSVVCHHNEEKRGGIWAKAHSNSSKLQEIRY